jgi:hypothetical protein
MGSLSQWETNSSYTTEQKRDVMFSTPVTRSYKRTKRTMRRRVVHESLKNQQGLICVQLIVVEAGGGGGGWGGGGGFKKY